MQYTENYSMNKPQFGDNSLVTKLNENADTLDTLIYNTRQMQAPPYDPDRDPAYSIGEIVTQNSALYICNTDGTTGPWDATKWDSTTLSKQIELAKQMGGESALADLDDVEITNPSTGQALLFDDSDDKWKNQNLPDVSVTKEASGNPIELTDAASAPIVKCVTQITGSQDLHGYDKPWVGGAGKNKFDDALIVNPTATAQWIQVTLKPNTNYTVSSNIPYYSTSAYIFAVSGTDTSGATSATDGVGLGTPRTVTADSNGIISFAYRNNGGSGVLDLTQYHYQIEEGTTASTFAPYSNICPITAYTEGEIVERGKNLFGDVLSNSGADFANGKFVNTNTDTFANFRPKIFLYKDGNAVYQLSMDAITSKGLYTANIGYGNASYDEMQFKHNDSVRDLSVNVKLDASGVLTLSFYCESFNPTTVGGIVIKDIQVEKGLTATTYEPYTFTTHTTTFPSAIYQGSEDVVNGEVTTEWGMIASYAGETLPGEWISDRDEYAPGTTPTTGAQVAYALATPTSASVTPTNLPIRTLSGYNHIESSTGDMEIEYITENYQPLVDLIQSSKHMYSTQEQIVGTWIDGSTVYEKTIAISGVVSGVYQISMSGIKDLISYSGYVNDNWTPASMLPIPRVASDGNNIGIGNVYNDYFTLIIPSAFSSRLYDPIITIRYTKPTATRSLNASVNAQKSISETLTDNTEEVPTEEEKAVEEENTNENR